MHGFVSSAIALLLLIVAAPSGAYDADLIPVRNRPELREMTGHVSITGEDGVVRANVSDVLDAAGDALDGRSLTLELRLRLNGFRRRVVLELPMSFGEGAAETSLGLRAGDRIVVASTRLRGPARKLLAEAGLLTAPAVTGPAPPLEECPSALESCQSDLALCSDDLDACESE